MLVYFHKIDKYGNLWFHVVCPKCQLAECWRRPDNIRRCRDQFGEIIPNNVITHITNLTCKKIENMAKANPNDSSPSTPFLYSVSNKQTCDDTSKDDATDTPDEIDEFEAMNNTSSAPVASSSSSSSASSASSSTPPAKADTSTLVESAWTNPKITSFKVKPNKHVNHEKFLYQLCEINIACSSYRFVKDNNLIHGVSFILTKMSHTATL